MRHSSKRVADSAEKTVRDIRRATRRHHSAEEKIRIVLEGLRGEDSIAELCRKEAINQNLYYRWSKEFLEAALQASGLNQVKVLHRPRLLSDNGPSYVSSELGKWLEDKGISHIRGRPYHPMTQGKIERYHRSMKNRILLENYYLPGQLEHSIGEFVDYYNNRRYHESLDNLTPADVYFGRGLDILKRRETIKRKTIEQRRRLHQQAIAA